MTEPTTENASSNWVRARRLVSGGRILLAGVALTAFAAGLAEAGFLVIVTRVGLAVADGQPSASLLGSWRPSLGIALAVAFGLVLLRLVLGLSMTSMSTRLVASVRLGLRRDLAGAYLESSWSVQRAEPSGRLAQLLTAFTNEAVGVVSALSNSISTALSLLALVGGALWVDPLSTIVVVIALLLLGALLSPIRKRIKLRSRSAAQAQLAFSTSVTELGTLGLEMQTYGVRAAFNRRVNELIAAEVGARRRADSLRTALPVVYTSLAYVALLGGLAVAGSVAEGRLETVGVVLLVMMRALAYGQQLQVASAGMLGSLPFLERLDETLAQYRTSSATVGTIRPESLGRIEVEGISFHYSSARPALDGVSFNLRPGQMVGVLGPSGGGKSTLVQLLLGMYTPSSGRILVSGVDLRDVDRRWWTERVAFVPQEPLLFTGTVSENIRFFRPEIDEAAVVAAAQHANVLEDIKQLDLGFETHLGERGSQLSGGQRQRISIARALVASPEFIILDEPTSSLDAATEARIRQTLESLRGQVTVVIIAHRMATLEMCDQLLVIEGGRLAASGPPSQLRRDNRFYRNALELSGVGSETK